MMRYKVYDAEYDERIVRSEFIRNNIEYGRVVPRGSQVDDAFKAMMKEEVENVWNVGKERNNEKIEHLSRKYERNLCVGMIRSIKYSDRDLDSIVDDNNNTANVLQYGEIELNENAKKALSMVPGFMMYEKIDDLNIEVEIEKGCTKSRYHFMSEVEVNDTANNNDDTQNDDNRTVLNLENKSSDYAKIRATDLPTVQHLFPPKPATMRREIVMQNIKDKMLAEVKIYKENNCNE